MSNQAPTPLEEAAMLLRLAQLMRTRRDEFFRSPTKDREKRAFAVERRFDIALNKFFSANPDLAPNAETPQKIELWLSNQP